MTILAWGGVARAQSIPLDIIPGSWQYYENGPISSAYRLGINVGLNGGEGREYLFDTGSDLFNIDVGNGASAPSWFPGAPTTTPVENLYPYMYGDGTYGYLVKPIRTQSIQFYDSSTSQQVASYDTPTGMPVAAATYQIATMGSLQGEPGVQINNPTLTSYGFTTEPYYQDLSWQQGIEQGTPPEEGHYFGTFGAGDFGHGVPGMLTSTGFIVEANGTETTPGKCGPACMIMGVTPALRAQFFSVLPWVAGPQGTFPLSGANASQEFDVLFKYTLSNGTTTHSAQLMTLLDSGTPSIMLTSGRLYEQAIDSGFIDPAADPYGEPTSLSNGNVRPGLTLTATGAAPGAQTETVKTGDDYGGDETDTPTIQPSDHLFNPPEAINGIGFYFRNAVLYDLEKAATAYTPFYVTDQNFDEGLHVTSDMGPLGLAGNLSGSGGLTVDQGAAAFLTGANTYTGATDIEKTGWLGLGGTTSIGQSSVVRDNGTLDLIHSQQGQEIQSLSGNGQVLLGTNTLVLTNANNAFSGVIRNFYVPGSMGTETPYPVISQSEDKGHYGGLIVNGGEQTLMGANTYTGATGIGEAGSLVLTGSLGNTSVLNAGVFRNEGVVAGSVASTGLVTGSGQFAGGLTVASGMVSPGNVALESAPGTMRVSGTFALGKNATYLVQTAGDRSSRIEVDGRAVISGATVSSPAMGRTQAPAMGQHYTVLTASGGISGQFGAANSTLTGPSGYLPFLMTSLGYTPNSVSLDITRSAVRFADAGLFRNEIETGRALDSMPTDMAVTRPLTQLNFAEARQAFRSLAGELHASARTAMIQDADVIRSAAVDRLRAAECAPGAGASAQTASYDHGQRVMDAACHTDRNAIWMQGYGEWSHNSHTANASGMRNETGGFIIGGDMSVYRGWRAGALFSYGHSGFSATTGGSASGQSNNLTVGAFGGRHWNRLGVRLGASYTWNLMSMNRTVFYPGFGDHAHTRSNAGTGQVFADVGYGLKWKRFSAEPFATLAYVNQNSRPFDETGGAAALHGYSHDTGVGFSTFGGRVATDVTVRRVRLQPSVSVGYRHTFGNILPVSRQAFLSGSDAYQVEGVPLVQDAAVVSAGVQTPITQRLRVNLSYNGQYGSHFTQSGVRGSVNWAF